MTVIAIPDELAVEVTADDIRNGKRYDNCECAVALALTRIPGVDSVFVELNDAGVYYRLDGELYYCTYLLPQRAADFIEAFDAEQPVKPFTFTADLVEWS